MQGDIQQGSRDSPIQESDNEMIQVLKSINNKTHFFTDDITIK
jgi:hypothetical protein